MEKLKLLALMEQNHELGHFKDSYKIKNSFLVLFVIAISRMFLSILQGTQDTPIAI